MATNESSIFASTFTDTTTEQLTLSNSNKRYHCSPRTIITLAGATESMLSSHYQLHQSTMPQISRRHHQSTMPQQAPKHHQPIKPQVPRHTQYQRMTAAAAMTAAMNVDNTKPYFPSMRILPASSRPIRITKRPHLCSNYYENSTDLAGGEQRQQQQHYRHQLQGSKEQDDDLSATSRELQLFYDEATWRMYHLIQASRLEKQEAAAAAAAAAASEDVVTSSSAACNQYEDDGMCFVGLPPQRSGRTLEIPIVSPDDQDDDDDDETGDSEGVFELDDL